MLIYIAIGLAVVVFAFCVGRLLGAFLKDEE
jgi:hypothetical protein